MLIQKCFGFFFSTSAILLLSYLTLETSESRNSKYSWSLEKLPFLSLKLG